MENEQNNQFDQRLRGVEARIKVLEEQGTKLDRLIYKLFKRLPKKAEGTNEISAETKTA